MTRVRLIAAALALTVAAPSAHANPFTLLAKAGKLAAKAGKAGKLAKAGTVAKGAKLLTAGVAAERVFAHAPVAAERVAVFVTRADDGLSAVVRGSDDVVAHADVGRVLGELDEMAMAAPEAGVDLFVDASALDDLAQLPIGTNTRVFVANLDGPSWPIERFLVADEAVQAARVDPGLGVRTFEHADLAFELLEAAVDLSQADLVLPDGTPCADALRSAAAELGFGLERDGGPVVALGADPDLERWATEQGLDLVSLGMHDVCAVDDAGQLRAIERLKALSAAATWKDVWAIPGTDAAPALVSDAVEHANAIVVSVTAEGAELRAVIGTIVPVEERSAVEKTLSFLCGLACVGVLVLALIGKLAGDAPRRQA